MDDPNQPLTKEKVIKRILLMIFGTIAFAAVMVFISYGKIPIKPFMIGLAIVLPIMIVSTILGIRHRQQILQSKSKLSYVYLILGLGMIIINGILVIIGERKINYYMQIGVGFMFLFYGIKQIKKS